MDKSPRKISFVYHILQGWPIITSLVFVIWLFATLSIRQEVQAGKITALESIATDISSIKIKVERIDERTLNMSSKGK